MATVDTTTTGEGFEYEDGKVYRLAIRKIKTTGGVQPREQINKDYVDELAEAIRSGAELPPVVAFYDGKTFWLSDGYHRHAAHLRAKLDDIRVEVRLGTQRDAVLHGAGANGFHGLRLTNADKRRNVMRFLNDETWHRWTNSRIAKACGVSDTFVESLRCHSIFPDPTFRIGLRKGKEFNSDRDSQATRSQKKAAADEPKSPLDGITEVQQETYRNPFPQYVKSLEVREIWHRENARTSLGPIRLETRDSIVEFVARMTPDSLLAAAMSLLVQKKRFYPNHQPLVLGYIPDDMFELVDAVKSFGVEVRHLA